MRGVQFHGVTYDVGGRRVFEALDGFAPAGGITAIVGPSGSGKSSLLGCTAGVLRPSAGRIALVSDTGEDGPLHPGDSSWVAQGSNALGARSVLDNVMIATLSEGAELHDARERSWEALREVGLGDRTRAQARSLSGGELQRVGFARALVARRPLVLADEPTANLDAINTQMIAGLLRDLRTEAVVMVATHDPVVVEVADVVIELR